MHGLALIFLVAVQIVCLASSKNNALWEPITESCGSHRNERLRPLTYPQMRINNELSMRLNHRQISWKPAPDGSIEISLPLPTQEIVEFQIYPTQIMPIELAKKYPNISTFSGTSVKNTREMSVDVTFSPYGGLTAYIVDNTNQYYIDPFEISNSEYKIYSGKHFDQKNKNSSEPWECDTHSPLDNHRTDYLSHIDDRSRTFNNANSDEYTFVLALITSGEYSQYHGNNARSIMEAVVTTISRVNSLYKRELGVFFQLHPRTDELFCYYPCHDLVNNKGIVRQMGNYLQNKKINFFSFDIAHSFTTGSGGVAMIGSLCAGGFNKANGGTTGLLHPVGDRFSIDFVAHELGHQLSAGHTYTDCRGNIGANAVEPGSGSTIMGYAGICGSNDLQPITDPIFHSWSIRQIANYLKTVTKESETCGSVHRGSIASPETRLSPTCSVPSNSYFQLGFRETEPSSFFSIEPVTISNDAKTVGNYHNRKIPRFRSWAPTNKTFRSIPSFYYIIHNLENDILDEIVPGREMTITFRGTTRNSFVRDRNGGFVGSKRGFGSFSYSDVDVDFHQVGKLTINSGMKKLNWKAGQTIDFIWGASRTMYISNDVGMYIAVHDPAMDFKEEKITDYEVQSGNFEWQKVAWFPNNGFAQIKLPKLRNARNGVVTVHVMLRSTNDDTCFFFDLLPFIVYQNY